MSSASPCSFFSTLCPLKVLSDSNTAPAPARAGFPVYIPVGAVPAVANDELRGELRAPRPHYVIRKDILEESAECPLRVGESGSPGPTASASLPNEPAKRARTRCLLRTGRCPQRTRPA